jgi:hypothetical protein
VGLIQARAVEPPASDAPQSARATGPRAMAGELMEWLRGVP